VASWGVGTKLASAFDQPTLGGVYKLSATRKSAGDPWTDHVKVTESVSKLTFPGVLDIRRYYNANGTIAGDMVFDVNHPVNDEGRIIDPFDELRQKKLGGLSSETLLKPLARDGEVVLEPAFRDAMAARDRTQAGLALLDESQKRMLNPHSYPVGLESGLFERRFALARKLRGIE
jgi:nicotinate phosphoribosyltransferase